MAFKVDLIRPDDLLNLHIEGVNLRLATESVEQPTIITENPQQPAYLVVTFPPQTIAEEAFFENGSPQPKGIEDNPTKQRLQHDQALVGRKLPTPGEKVAVRLGGPSKLVFQVPPERSMPFTLKSLLDWSGLELVVSPAAAVEPNGPLPDADLSIRAPGNLETALELPYRLQISPNHRATWVHALAVVSHQGRAELWHTRLAERGEDGILHPADNLNPVPLRAIWSPDYNPNQMPSPGDLGTLGALGAMSPADRHQIVVLTSAFQGYAQNVFQAYVPQPFYASQLMLSPLGGWLHSVGAWNPPYKIKPLPIVVPPIWRDAFDLKLFFEDSNGDRRLLPNLPAGQETVTSPVGATAGAGGRAPITPPPTPTIAPTTTASPTVSPPAVGKVTIAPAATPAPEALSLDRLIDLGDLDVSLLSHDLGDIILRPRYQLGPQLDLSQWVHIASQGRDHYVRIVYEGRLKSLGHRAALIKVTERRFEPSNNSSAPVAFLRQYMYLIVREPVKDYTQEGLPHDGRGMPLKQIRLTTLVTPKIDYPYPSPTNPNNNPALPGYNPAAITNRSFWVRVGNQDFRFHAVGTDVAGNQIDFTMPLIFVPNSETNLAAIETEYNNPANSQRRSALVPGQKLTFAPPSGDGKDNTSFVTQSLNFVNEGAGSKADFFKPRLFKADVRIPAVEQLVGSNTLSSIQLLSDYVVGGGFGNAANATGAFAKVVKENATGLLEDAAAGVGFSAEQAGGFATPNLDITTLTRSLGPLGGKVTDALADTFKPEQVFGKGLAQIFGAFDLADLILPGGSAGKNAPKMQIRREGTTAIAELDWKPNVQTIDLVVIKFTPYPDTVLDVHGTFKKSLVGPTNDEFQLTGRLNHFEIFFLRVVQINFDLFTFTAQNGKKTDVNVKLNDQTPVEFSGDLAFVEGLRKLIPPGVFGDGVSIDLIQSPLGVKAGLSIGLPPASVGVFALQNILFAAALTLPFLEGKPIFDFAFARRDSPFLLTVSLFGGGGFFRLELDTEGIRVLEAAFEFGAAAALDIGVASGEVHIMAGIYFKLEKRLLPAPISAEKLVSVLSGYLRCGGKLSVLGIVTVSVEFYLSFTYDSGTDKASGRATLTVTIEVLFFSKSIELTVERSFGGKSGDPTFGQLMDTPEVWNEYALAFA